MTRSQLDRAVASATGESPRTVRARGFGLAADGPDDLDSEGLALVLDCPFCRAPVPYPGRAGDGALPMAECLGCDVYFPFEQVSGPKGSQDRQKYEYDKAEANPTMDDSVFRFPATQPAAAANK